MRILSHLQSNRSQHTKTSSSSGKKSQVKDLRKSDLIADMFNNHTDAKEEKRTAKVRLSRTSQALSHELQQAIHYFLQKNKTLAKHVNAIELPESDSPFVHATADLSVRKLNVYKQWLDMRELDEGVDEIELPSDSPFYKIQDEGKDQEILDLYHNHHERQAEIKASRSKTILNYYYLLFPEAYAFN